jgi:methylglutamate dehydrogenase subunit D
MLDQRSALAIAKPFASPKLTMQESPDFTLTQVAGLEKDIKKALGKIPTTVGVALTDKERTMFRISPQQFWLVNGAAPTETTLVFVTPLSSSRTRIAIEGSAVRALLAKCSAIDFDARVFRPGLFAMTGIHHTPVLIHCLAENHFHIYALRTFALNTWDWLADAALEFA